MTKEKLIAYMDNTSRDEHVSTNASMFYLVATNKILKVRH